MNWLDLLVIIFVALAVLDGWRRGLILQTLELVAFLAAIWFGLRYYANLADWLVGHYHVSVLLAKPVAFLALWLVAEGVSFLLLWLISRVIPETVKRTRWNHLLGVVPAVAKTVVYLGVGLSILVFLPLSSDLKTGIQESRVAPALIRATSGITTWLERSLGRTFGESLTFLTTPTTGAGYHIPAVPLAKLQVEPGLESQMLALLNAERVKVGLAPLKFDTETQAVARAHSQDMWQRGYFDHLDPEGKGVGERLAAAGLTFQIAGENLALAPTLLIAHEGLMHSLSHRENMLHPNFHRVGIGIISAGANGLMVTQNFRD